MSYTNTFGLKTSPIALSDLDTAFQETANGQFNASQAYDNTTIGYALGQRITSAQAAALFNTSLNQFQANFLPIAAQNIRLADGTNVQAAITALRQGQGTPSPSAPTLTAAPTISGSGILGAGAVFTVVPGAANEGTGGSHTNSFQFLKTDTTGTSPITGAGANLTGIPSGQNVSYAYTSALLGDRISVQQTAIDSTGLASSPRTSNLSNVVSANGIVPTNSGGANAPQFSISGNQAAGATFNISVGTWTFVSAYQAPTRLGANIHVGMDTVANNSLMAQIFAQRNLTEARMDLATGLNMTLWNDAASKLIANGVRIQTGIQTSYQFDNNVVYPIAGHTLAQVTADAYAQAANLIALVAPLGVLDFELFNEIQLRTECQAQMTFNGTQHTAAQYAACSAYRSWAAILIGTANAIADYRAATGKQTRCILTFVNNEYNFITYMLSQGVKIDVVGWHGAGFATDANPMGTDPYFNSPIGPGAVAMTTQFGLPVTVNELTASEIFQTGTYTDLANSSFTHNAALSINYHLPSMLKPGIESVLAYELLNEPAKAAPENHFGLLYDLNTPKIFLSEWSAYAAGYVSPAEAAILTGNGIFAGGGYTTYSVQILNNGQAYGAPITTTANQVSGLILANLPAHVFTASVIATSNLGAPSAAALSNNSITVTGAAGINSTQPTIVGAANIGGVQTIYSGLTYPINPPVYTDATTSAVLTPTSKTYYFYLSGDPAGFSYANNPYGDYVDIWNYQGAAGRTKFPDPLTNDNLTMTCVATFADGRTATTALSGAIVYDIAAAAAVLTGTIAVSPLSLTSGASVNTTPFVVTGGTPPYSIAAVPALSNSGLTLNKLSGLVTGVAGNVENVTEVFTATDSAGGVVTGNLILVISNSSSIPTDLSLYADTSFASQAAHYIQHGSYGILTNTVSDAINGGFTPAGYTQPVNGILARFGKVQINGKTYWRQACLPGYDQQDSGTRTDVLYGQSNSFAEGETLWYAHRMWLSSSIINDPNAQGVWSDLHGNGDFGGFYYQFYGHNPAPTNMFAESVIANGDFSFQLNVGVGTGLILDGDCDVVVRIKVGRNGNGGAQFWYNPTSATVNSPTVQSGGDTMLNTGDAPMYLKSACYNGAVGTSPMWINFSSFVGVRDNNGQFNAVGIRSLLR